MTEYMNNKTLESLIKLFNEGRITHHSFIDIIIRDQKKAQIIGVLRDTEKRGELDIEIFLKKMTRRGVEVSI